MGLLVAVALPLAAQQPPTRRAPAQPRAAAPDRPARPDSGHRQQMRQNQGPSPEAMLRMREQLGLTEAQVTRLEALRVEGVAARRTQMAEMIEFQSQVQAGKITAEQARERREAQAGQAPATGQQALGDRVRTVLTDPQRLRLAEQQVEQMRRQLQSRQGRGANGGRGMQRGGRGDMRSTGRGRMMPARPGMQPGAGAAAPEVRERMQQRMRQRAAMPARPPRDSN